MLRRLRKCFIFASVSALCSCYGVSFINDKNLNLDIAILNLPADYSGTTELAVTVISSKAKNYRYKVGPSGALDCAVADGYSDSKDIAQSIQQSIASIPDGLVKICVVPVQQNTVALESHVASTWIKDAACPNRPFNAGTGTVSDPYLICSPDSLIYMSQNTSALSLKYFKLTANLDLTTVPFEGIGTNASPFTGHFDGNGNTITGFSRVVTDPVPVGFFNVVGDNTTIQNLNFVGANISGGNGTGILVGFADGNMTVDHVTVGGTLDGDTYAAGIVGQFWFTPSKVLNLTNVSNSANIRGNFYGSGIVGYIQGDAVISNAMNSGNIEGGAFAGGIVGTCVGSSGSNCVLNLSNSQNAGAITGLGYVGGIAGSLYGASLAQMVVREVFNSGALTGDISYAGGIAAVLFGQLEDSYSSGNITTNWNGVYGGLVADIWGPASRIYRSYATGSINDNGGYGANTSTCGGLVGRSWGVTEIYDSFSTTTLICSSNTNWVGRIIGFNSGSTVSNCSSVSGSTCTNPAGSCGGTAGTARPSLAHFHNSGNAPVSSWDAATIWLFTGSALPTLR